MTDHDEVHEALEERLKTLNTKVTGWASAETVAAEFGKRAKRIEAIERKLGEVEGDREALPSDIPRPL